MHVSITINGEQVSREIEPRQLLVHFIRDTPGLTGTHWGCDTSNCGACVVLMDGKPVKSCTILAAMCEGHEIRTVESLEVDGQLDPVQQGFHERHALQCGFCTPGMLMTARALLDENPDPDRARDPHRDLGRHLPLHRATRTSSAPCAGRPSTKPPAKQEGSEHGRHVENLPSADDRAADRLRPAEAQGGRALHPRQGHLPGRHPAARDGLRRDPAQPVRARAHRLDRHLAGRSRTRTSPPSSPPRTSRRSGSPGCRRSPTTRRPCSRATRSASRARRSRS